jgi:hypothetical protein
MLQNKTGLLLAGLAAYAAYRYSKMSIEQKTSLKEKGRKLADRYLPGNLKNIFGSEPETAAENSGSFKPGF